MQLILLCKNKGYLEDKNGFRWYLWGEPNVWSNFHRVTLDNVTPSVHGMIIERTGREEGDLAIIIVEDAERYCEALARKKTEQGG